MAECSKARRRWPWGLVAISLLLLGGPIAWQLRPLNSTERKLVGTWRSDDGVGGDLVLQADRSFLITSPSIWIPERRLALATRGTWSASEGKLWLVDASADPRQDVWSAILRLQATLLGRSDSAKVRPLLIHGPNRIQIQIRYHSRIIPDPGLNWVQTWESNPFENFVETGPEAPDLFREDL